MVANCDLGDAAPVDLYDWHVYTGVRLSSAVALLCSALAAGFGAFHLIQPRSSCARHTASACRAWLRRHGDLFFGLCTAFDGLRPERDAHIFASECSVRCQTS